MRFANAMLGFTLALAGACSSAGLPANGDGGGGDDLAGSSFDRSLFDDNPGGDLSQGAPPDFSGVDFASLSCLSTCQHCQGVCCGAGCCDVGEWCDNGTCRCGMGNGCPAGEMCVSNIAMQNGCGFICCGNGVPCPG